ncbi:hypothetical protein [Sporolactobacillus laevolacticus]|uniref:hypothetical protein n=1 Tax=Sporolactobacillus laevolacticus TaxID=33018 RepID=UPI0025B4C5A6|nr:hypothetical protein [Sporolactobacillus laevolacticus]MDN3956218.1 hypothetical protein [Sporolactobacillus laevolacticus]
MIDLHESMQNTISQLDAIIDGWTLGRLIIDLGHCFLALEIGEVILLNHGQFEIEVSNGDEFVPVTIDHILNCKTDEGWPLFAGLDARIRQRRAA